MQKAPFILALGLMLPVIGATAHAQTPQGVSPQPMPSAVAQKVPQVKAHRYFLTEEQVVIVDPKDNKVVEVIKLQGE